MLVLYKSARLRLSRTRYSTAGFSLREAFSRALSLQAENGFLEKERTQFAFGFAKYKAGSKTDSQAIDKTKNRPKWSVFRFMAGDLGFEPRHTESESAVLPLHKSPMPYKYITRFFSCQENFDKNLS